MLNNKFEQIYEKSFEIYPSSMKIVKRTIYPKEMKFSEEFLEALKTEFGRFKVLEEDGDSKPIKNLEEKFLKAMGFVVRGM